MKNAAGVLLAVLVAVGAAAAQGSTAGLKAGPMLSFAGEGSSIYNASNLFGLKAGFFYAHRLSDVISLQPEVQFALTGARYYSSITRHEESVHFNYLEIPLLVNARIASDRLELFAGPYAALLLSHTPLDETHVWTWRENERSEILVARRLGGGPVYARLRQRPPRGLSRRNNPRPP